MEKQFFSNNFKKARHERIELNRIECISRHVVTIFRNINTFQDAISPKAI